MNMHNARKEQGMNPPTAKHQRHLRNYVLDTRFQFKYTALIVAVALGTGAVAGTLLMSSLSKSEAQSAHLVELAGTLATESRKVSDVTRMSMKDAYADSPELLQAFNTDADKEAAKIAAREQELKASHAALASTQTRTVRLVGASFAAFLLILCALGIYITHRVAGPVFRMKHLLREAAAGRLLFDRGLRQGDELQDLYAVFKEMIVAMRERQLAEVARVQALAATARASHGDAALTVELEALLREMRAAADKSTATGLPPAL